MKQEGFRHSVGVWPISSFLAFSADSGLTVDIVVFMCRWTVDYLKSDKIDTRLLCTARRATCDEYLEVFRSLGLSGFYCRPCLRQALCATTDALTVLRQQPIILQSCRHIGRRDLAGFPQLYHSNLRTRAFAKTRTSQTT